MGETESQSITGFWKWESLFFFFQIKKPTSQEGTRSVQCHPANKEQSQPPIPRSLTPKPVSRTKCFLGFRVSPTLPALGRGQGLRGLDSGSDSELPRHPAAQTRVTLSPLKTFLNFLSYSEMLAGGIWVSWVFWACSEPPNPPQGVKVGVGHTSAI